MRFNRFLPAAAATALAFPTFAFIAQESIAQDDSSMGFFITSSGNGSAMLGHHDRQGGGSNFTSWNSAHLSRGCSQNNLRSTGGDGLVYCFALIALLAGDADQDLDFDQLDLVQVQVAAKYLTALAAT